MRIRSLAPGDKAQWELLWKGYQEFYGADLEDGKESLWQRLLSDDPLEPVCLVAEADGKLLGLVHYLFHGSTWSPKKRIYLNDLYTIPEARGKGVGRTLIEAVYKAADDSDAETVYWLTQDFNTAGRALYDKIGTLTPFIKYQR